MNDTQPASRARSSDQETACTMESTKVSEPDHDSITMIVPTKIQKKWTANHDEEPLVDTTAPLQLHSKRTERLRKRHKKKTDKNTVRSETQSFLELPPELLHEVLRYLTPSDVLRLRQLNRATFEFIQQSQNSIASAIIKQRYWVLSQSFPLPVPVSKVDSTAKSSILSTAWQDRIKIHKNPYQHLRRIDSQQLCTCTSCVLAWNNLCLILDLAYFQHNLRERDPIPMIPRGSHPEWNEKLVNTHAHIVERAVSDPLVYAAILQKHLATVVGTLTRQVRVGKRTFHPRKLYHLSELDIEAGTDEFLERRGDPSYEFPYHRDKYYDLEAYVPNRKWSTSLGRWQYAKAGEPHERDLAWVTAWYKPDPVHDDDDVEQFVSAFAQRLST